MFKYLRQNAKTFYWVIAATFILFLFLGGLTGRGCQAPGTRQLDAGVIGSVNGIEIHGRDYEQDRRGILSRYRMQSQGREINANQVASASDIAWQTQINRILSQQGVEEYGIEVTPEEILNAFEYDPPQQILQNWRREDGTIDMDQYYADLRNPERDWSGLEEWVRAILTEEKFYDIITAGIEVTDEEIRDEFIRQSGRAVAEWVGLLYAEMEVEYTPDDNELDAYFQAHLDDYQRPASATCSVVRYAKAASDADYDEIRDYILEIRQEIVSGQTDFETAAKEYSEDGSAASGGDLGTFDRNRMVAPFTEAAFSLAVGEVSEPVKTQFGYHLIEVLEQETAEDSDEVVKVHARHILLKVEPGTETIGSIYETAKAFRDGVDAGTFVSTALTDSLDLLTPDSFYEGRDIPGLALSLQGSQWAHAAEPGEISPIFENTSFFYVILAGEVTPAGAAHFEEVRGQVELAVTREHNQEVAGERLSPAVGAIQMGKSFEEVATEYDLKYAVTDTFTVTGNVADVGYGTDFNFTVITGEVGRPTDEIETMRGLYIAVPRWIEPFDADKLAERAEGIRSALMSTKQQEAITKWYEDRTEAAEIVDLRHQMLQRSL